MRFKDGEFNFFTAIYGSWKQDQRVVFRVKKGREPQDRAIEKGIKYYDRLIPSSPQEIKLWQKSHPSFKEIKEKRP